MTKGRFASWALALVGPVAIAGCANNAAPDTGENAYTVERVAFVMRHGIRPPTKTPAIPEGYAAQPWPEWGVEAGMLTKRGAEGVALLGAADRARYIDAGLLAADGCPAAGAIYAEASWKPRAIDTGKAYLDTFAPGCDITVIHPETEENDVVFHPLDAGLDDFDGALAYKQALAMAPEGGLQAEVQQDSALIASLQSVLNCCTVARCREEDQQAECKLPDVPTELVENEHGRAELEGPLDVGSTASQTFLLEYLEGMPMEQVGWGRLTRDQIENLLRFHPIKFRYENGPPYVAARAAGPLMQRILGAMTAQDDAPRFTLLFGHDTNLADLGSLLNLNWKVDSYPEGDIPPGGALGFELVRDGSGDRFVRAFFRAQTMDQLRNQVNLVGGSHPFRQTVAITDCKSQASDTDLCPIGRFAAIVTDRLAEGHVK